MSISRTGTIDAVTIRDGWVVLTIHQFEEWGDVESAVEEFRQKLLTYELFVESPRFQIPFHTLPARVVLEIPSLGVKVPFEGEIRLK